MELLTNLEQYIHYEEKDPLVQLAIMHAQFESIHPFLDGNEKRGQDTHTIIPDGKGTAGQPGILHERLPGSAPRYLL